MMIVEIISGTSLKQKEKILLGGGILVETTGAITRVRTQMTTIWEIRMRMVMRMETTVPGIIIL